MKFTHICLAVIAFLTHPAFASNEALSFYASAEGGIVYDSNVSIDEVDIRLSKGDGAVRTSASVGALGHWTDGVEASVDVSVFDTRYFEYDTFDTNTLMLSSMLAYDAGDVDVSLDYFYAANTLDGEKFLTLSKLQPSISGFIDRALYLRFALGLEQKNFYQSEGRDATQYGLSGKAYYFFNATQRYLGFSYQYSSENAADDQFDYRGNQVRVSWHEKASVLGYKAKWKVELIYDQQSYHKIPEQDGGSQDDDQYSMLAELKMDLRSNTYIKFAYEVFKNNSSNHDQNYTQHIVEVLYGVAI